MKRYPAYKDSGVEWLGQVPEGWEVFPAKRLLRLRKQINTGMACNNRLALTMNGVVPRDIDDLDGLQSSNYEGYQIFEPGDLAFKLIDLQNIKTSRVGQVLERGIMSPAYIRLTPIRISSRYAYWYFMALYWTQVFNSLGGGVRQTLGPEELLNIGVPLPPLPEQQAIAAFLDRETAKIDGLIEEQRRLIALLAEKRQATISHAVTRGLNPSARFKPSGVDWLGDIPEGWTICRLKDCAVPAEGIQMGPFGGMLKDLLGEPDEFKVYGQENVTNGDFDRGGRWLDGKRFAELSNYALQVGDLMLTRKGSIGNCFIFSDKAQPEIIDSDTIRIRLNEDMLNAQYALTLLHDADYISKQIDLTKRGAILASLNTSVVGNLFVLRPPKVEQAEINQFIACERSAFDALTEAATSAITLLQERRAALISAAVTGWIDVRDVALVSEAA